MATLHTLCLLMVGMMYGIKIRKEHFLWNTVHNVKITALSMLCNVAEAAGLLVSNRGSTVMVMRATAFTVITNL